MQFAMVRRSIFSGLFSLCALAACGGSGTPAQDATSEKSEKPAQAATADDTAEESATESDTKDTADKDAKADAKSGKSGSAKPALSRKPKDFLVMPGVMFMLTFNESDVKERAEQECSNKSKGDTEKQADCMAAAQKKFDADGYHFEQDDAGKWWWMTVRVRGNDVKWLHRIPIEFADETDHSVTIKTTGRDTGTSPGKVPAEVVIEVPNEYQIVVNDPQHGKLVYTAKMGMASGDKPDKRR
jgi:hypothetical protein